MIIEGRISRMSLDESIIVNLDANDEKIDVVLPLTFKPHLNKVPNNTTMTIEGNFEVLDSKIYFNQTMKLTFGAKEMQEKSTDIVDMVHEKYCDILCVVVGWYEPKQSQGSDFVCTVEVVDKSVKEKTKVRIFTKENVFFEGFFPGDVLKICHVKMVEPGLCLAGKKVKIKTLYSEKTGVYDPECDKEHVENLREYYTSVKSKFVRLKCISDVEPNTFCDLLGLLVGIRAETPNLVILTLVDYTVNANVHKGKDIMGFENGMVIFVKAWESYAQVAKDCVLQDILLIRNLKITQVADTIIGSLSESRSGGIIKLLKNHVLRKSLEIRRKRFEDTLENERRNIETVPRFNMLELYTISSLSEEGLYRVRGYIRYTIPLKPKTIYRCTTCNTARIQPLTKCNKNCIQFQEKIVRALLCDPTGSITVVCKDKVVDALFSCMNQGFIRLNYFDSLLLRYETPVGVVNHMIDAGFVP